MPFPAERRNLWRAVVVANAAAVLAGTVIFFLALASWNTQVDRIDRVVAQNTRLVAEGQKARKTQCLTSPVTLPAIIRSGIFTRRELAYLTAVQPQSARPETCRGLLTKRERARQMEVIHNR